MSRLPKRAVDALARVESRLRVRLHQAANRVEDADPLDVGVAESGVRALDVVDRLTGFRAAHRARVVIPGGVRRPVPAPPGAAWAGDLDPASLPAASRARLKQRHARMLASSPEAREAAERAWRQELEAARLLIDPR